MYITYTSFITLGDACYLRLEVHYILRIKIRPRVGTLGTSFLVALAITLMVIPVTAMWYQGLDVNVTAKVGYTHWGITSFKGWQLIKTHGMCHCSFGYCKPLTTITLLPGSHTLQAQINTTLNYTYTEGSGRRCGCNHSVIGHVKKVWVGMMIRNEGTIPLKLRGINVLAVGNNPPTGWDMQAYFYGPLNGRYGSLVREFMWRRSSCCTPYGVHDRAAPITLNPGDEAIVWTKITLPCGNATYTYQFTPEITPFNTG